MLIQELTQGQRREVEELKKTYGNSAYLATEGSASLIDMLLEAQQEDDIMEIVKLEINFYKDISAQFLGELIHIIFKNTHTL